MHSTLKDVYLYFNYYELKEVCLFYQNNNIYNTMSFNV